MGKKKLSKEQKTYLKAVADQFENLKSFADQIKWVGDVNFKDAMFDGSVSGSYAVFSVYGDPDELLKKYKTYDCFDDCVIVDCLENAKAFLKYNSITHGIVVDLIKKEIVVEESRTYGPGFTEPESWNNWIRRTCFSSED